jgi:hypothetical protein
VQACAGAARGVPRGVMQVHRTQHRLQHDTGKDIVKGSTAVGALIGGAQQAAYYVVWGCEFGLLHEQQPAQCRHWQVLHVVYCFVVMQVCRTQSRVGSSITRIARQQGVWCAVGLRCSMHCSRQWLCRQHTDSHNESLTPSSGARQLLLEAPDLNHSCCAVLCCVSPLPSTVAHGFLHQAAGACSCCL